MINQIPDDIYEALYYYQKEGEDGYDLSEVITLGDRKDINRIQKLKEILDSDNRYYAYQATQILVAWNFIEGYNKLIQIVNERWDKQESFSPHRIYDTETMYEEFAFCIEISTYNGNSELKKLNLSRLLIKLFTEKKIYLNENFKQLLLSLRLLDQLVIELDYSIGVVIDQQPTKASALLPVLTKIDAKYYFKYISSFEDLAEDDRWIDANIREAKEILKTI